MEKNMPLHSRTDKELMTLLHNTMNHCDQKRALDKKREVYKIWSFRNELFTSGTRLNVHPWDGVLSAFGYHVGDNGINDTKKRHKILDHVLEAPIPPVRDPAYVKEWGKPNSRKRIRKLERTLIGLYKGFSKIKTNRQISYERAINQWKMDLQYIRQFSI